MARKVLRGRPHTRAHFTSEIGQRGRTSSQGWSSEAKHVSYMCAALDSSPRTPAINSGEAPRPSQSPPQHATDLEKAFRLGRTEEKKKKMHVCKMSLKTRGVECARVGNAGRHGRQGVRAALGPGAHTGQALPQKDKTVLLMISTDSRISSSLITSGGASLMMSPWVGLARSPLSRRRRHTFQAL